MPTNSTLSRRRFLQASSASVAGVGLLGSTALAAKSPNEQIGLGFIGLGGRGLRLAELFSRQSGARFAAFCEVDRDRLNSAADKHGVQNRYISHEDLLDDPGVDAVVIATCNHWHCLPAIHACQAGKHVYVEKPLGHDLWQQQQLIAAARRYDRVVQVGTQQRSDPMQAEVRRFLHEEKALGELQGAIACRLGARAAVGQRSKPLSPPDSVDVDRWFGPAARAPMYRDKFHYDWHWDWATGNGEMGNWGVHVLDDVRNVVLNDSVAAPTAVAGLGARAAWDDAGQTPNVHVSLFETPAMPIACIINNLREPKGAEPPRLGGVAAGYVVSCEGGRYEGRRGGGRAYDASGKLVREFTGSSGEREHCGNFLEAVRQNDRHLLTADVQVGHDSSSWCHYGNAAYLAGVPASASQIDSVVGEAAPWRHAVESVRGWMGELGISADDAPFKASAWRAIDSETGRVAGAADDASSRVYRGEYRQGYAIPDVMGA
ncbi:MAG: Gfo/Idh/MocA family oxidoreductase [Planctomycetota bacterium]